MTTDKFEVIVGNIGTIYRGDDRMEASEQFRLYSTLSKAQYGRCAGEQVIMFECGEPVLQHAGQYEY